MPVTLTNPIVNGDETLTQVKIVRYRLDAVNKRLLLRWEYGNTVNGNWVGSRYRPQGTLLRDRIRGTDYDSLVAAMPGEGETIYQATKKKMYEFLQAAGKVPAGTIED